jgi:hypothetical protein
MEFLLPQPDSLGISEIKELYLRKFGRILTDGEAAQVLGMVMRHLFLINNPCSGTASTLENQTTTNR